MAGKRPSSTVVDVAEKRRAGTARARKRTAFPALSLTPARRYDLFSSAEELLAFTRKEDVRFLDVRFTDLFGSTHHFTIPIGHVNAKAFDEGLMFDGSSIRGFQAIHESDMLLLPDFSTAVLDDFREHTTLNLTFFVHAPFTRESYSRDPRNVARKAEAYVTGSGIADTVFFGPEAEFYIFDDVRFQTRENASFYYIDSVEGAWNTG